jgi:hypothetical protein
MKTQITTIALIIHFSFFIIHSGHSQDSLRYSQESGTLEKQRFIDQYDYVFMTKEPTRWMGKLYASTNQTSGGGEVAAFEAKLSNSFSIGGGVYLHGSSSTTGGINAGMFGELRYYYDMNKRIREGRSANNFSGNYIGFSTLQTFNKKASIGGDKTLFFGSLFNYSPVFQNTYELKWGLQRRFFNHSFADFGFTGGMATYNINNSLHSEPFFQSHWGLGFAFGDFKRKKIPPLCDLFRCNEDSKTLFKVFWPNIFIGANRQSFAGAIAIEHKLGRLPLSINLQQEVKFENIDYKNIQGLGYAYDSLLKQYIWKSTNEVQSIGSNSLSSVSYLQLRYYLQDDVRSINRSPLTGWYVGLSMIHSHNKTNVLIGNNTPIESKYNALQAGFIIGYQQKIFKKGIVDFGIIIAKDIHIFSNTSRFGSPPIYIPLHIGFAF